MKWRAAAVAFVAVVGMIALARLVGGLRAGSVRAVVPSTRVEGQAGTTEPLDTARFTLVATAGPQAVARALADRMSDAPGHTHVPGAGEFDVAAAGAIVAYFSPTPSEFNTYLNEQGISPWTQGNPKADAEAWSNFQRAVSGAMLDPASLAVRPRIIAGSPVRAPQDTHVRAAERPLARPKGLQHPQSAFELTVDGVFLGRDGGRFVGTLGFEFGLDQESSKWGLIRIRMYDVPNGVHVASLPI